MTLLYSIFALIILIGGYLWVTRVGLVGNRLTCSMLIWISVPQGGEWSQPQRLVFGYNCGKCLEGRKASLESHNGAGKDFRGRDVHMEPYGVTAVSQEGRGVPGERKAVEEPGPQEQHGGDVVHWQEGAATHRGWEQVHRGPAAVGTLSRLLAQAHSVSEGPFSRVTLDAMCRLEWP